MIRYDLQTLDPMQGVVVVEPTGDFTLLYEPITDPLLKRCFEYRRLLLPSPSTSPTVSKILQMVPPLRSLLKALPFAPNLSKPDFVPSKAVLFLERLRTQLPQHRLLVADFDTLPDTVPGRNGPVVQTRVKHEMIPCETFLVKQGYFDIFFPTGEWSGAKTRRLDRPPKICDTEILRGRSSPADAQISSSCAIPTPSS